MKKILALILTLAFVLAIPAAIWADPDDDSQSEDENIIIREGDSGDYVYSVQMRLRDLGYFSYKITGEFGGYTTNALKSFQSENSLTSDGIAGQKTLDVLYGNDAKRAPVKEVKKPVVVAPSGSGSKSVRKGQLKEWSWVHKNWPRGGKATVIDYNTGKQYTMVRVGGSKHADVEPATKKDCGILKATYGGSWSWARRAVIFNIKGTWVAGSINGMPHGYETVANNDMTGQVCIHALNSATHVRGIADPDHQRMVRRAAGQ